MKKTSKGKEVTPIVEDDITFINRKAKYLKLYTNAKKHWDKSYGEKFKAYKNAFDGTVRRDTLASWRSHINIPTAFATVRSELVRIKKGLFNDPIGNFWGLQPINWTEQNQNVADIYGFILEKQREVGHWSQSLHSIAEDSIKLGVGWAKVEWKREDFCSSYFDQIEGKVKTIKQKQTIVDGNVITRLDPFKIFPDPTAQTYWDCKFIGEMVKLTREELEENENELFNQESEYNKLLDKIKHRKEEDEFDGFYIYMRDKLVLFVEDLMIMEIENPYKHSMIPIIPMIKYPDGGNVIGKGTIEIIYDLLEWQNSLYNLAADNLEMAVHKIFIHEKSDPLDAKSLDIYPSKIIALNTGEKFSTLDMGTVPLAYFQEMKDLKGLFNEAVGSLDILNAPEGMGNGQNTLGGMNMVLNEANMVFADAITLNKDNFIIPIVKMLHKNCQQFMKPNEMKDVLTEDQIEAFDLKAKDLDMDIDFNYLAVGDSSLETEASKMSKIMATIPVLTQIIQASMIPQLAEKVNFNEMIKFVLTTFKVPKEMINKNLETNKSTDTPDIQGKKNQMVQLVMALAQKTGRNPEEITKLMIEGKSPQEILQMFGNKEVISVDEQSSANAPQVASTNAAVLAPTK